MLTPGSAAPAFSLSDQHGTNVTLSDQAGKWVVLWWYPKASTPG
jgi:thioredoxin-dependent peroxiredoxin